MPSSTYIMAKTDPRTVSFVTAELLVSYGRQKRAKSSSSYISGFVSLDRNVSARRPCPMEFLRSSAGGVSLLSFRIWSIHLRQGHRGLFHSWLGGPPRRQVDATRHRRTLWTDLLSCSL